MKTVFKNQTFFYLLISFISILILWNVYGGIINENIWAIIPVLIEIVLLLFIFNRYEHARIAIIVWTAIALIAAPACGLLATLFDIGNNFIDNQTGAIGIYGVVLNVIDLAVGVLILDYTRRTIKVEFPENEKLNNAD
jgi:hypothetical protein